MTDRIRIEFAHEEGAIVRILGSVERRGYRLTGLAMSGAVLTIDLAPRDPGRRLDVLAAQLRRLHDVTSVTPFPAIASAA